MVIPIHALFLFPHCHNNASEIAYSIVRQPYLPPNAHISILRHFCIVYDPMCHVAK